MNCSMTAAAAVVLKKKHNITVKRVCFLESLVFFCDDSSASSGDLAEPVLTTDRSAVASQGFRLGC